MLRSFQSPHGLLFSSAPRSSFTYWLSGVTCFYECSVVQSDQGPSSSYHSLVLSTWSAKPSSSRSCSFVCTSRLPSHCGSPQISCLLGLSLHTWAFGPALHTGVSSPSQNRTPSHSAWHSFSAIASWPCSLECSVQTRKSALLAQSWSTVYSSQHSSPDHSAYRTTPDCLACPD